MQVAEYDFFNVLARLIVVQNGREIYISKSLGSFLFVPSTHYAE